jgi:hypothetical protein
MSHFRKRGGAQSGLLLSLNNCVCTPKQSISTIKHTLVQVKTHQLSSCQGGPQLKMESVSFTMLFTCILA